MKLARLALLACACALGQAASAQWSAPELEELFGSTSWGPSIACGQSLDFDGGTLVAGAPQVNHPSGTNDIGYVHVFEENAEGIWNQIQLLEASAPQAFAAFGTSVALDGDTLVVGAPYEGSSGAAYVFTRSPGGGGSFTEAVKLSSGTTQFGIFGISVDIDGDVIVVGDEAWSSFAGRAHVFERDQGGPGAWGEVAVLPEGAFFNTGSRFGQEVAVCGDTIAAAAPSHEEVRVFERNQGGPGAWGEVIVLTPANLHANSSFGYGLTLDGDTIVASGSLTGPKQAGKAYVFERDHGGSNAWGEAASFQGSGLPQWAGFGGSLSLDGDLLVAGTPGSLFSTEVGSAHVFHRNLGGQDAWGEVARLDPSDGGVLDQFGVDLVVQEGTVWIGAPLHDEVGTDAGAVFGYEVAHTPESYCTAGTSSAGCVALIGAAGAASATAGAGFDLSASGVEGRRNGLFFYGANGRQANPWGTGTSLQCVVPPVKRTDPQLGIGTSGLCDGAFAFDLNANWCPSCPKAHHNPGAGALVQAQLWYRDPQSSSNQTTSLSDAIEFLVAP